MSSHNVPSPIRRFILPAMCGVLTVVSANWGETVLVRYAGLPAMGPLVAAQVATLVAIAFGLLCLVTTILAVFPGKDADPTEDSEAEAALGSLVAEADGELPDDKAQGRESERSATDIISALKKSATKQATARREAEQRHKEALTANAELREQLFAYQSGTAPEFKALEARARDEASRDALRQIEDLSVAADRRAEALKDARTRVEADLAAATQALAAKDEQIAALRSQIEVARREGAVDEYRRLCLAVTAINDTTIDFHDHLQQEAVARHAQRIREALIRLDPAATSAFDPGVTMPPLNATAPAASSEAQPKEEGRRRRLLRERKSKH